MRRLAHMLVVGGLAACGVFVLGAGPASAQYYPPPGYYPPPPPPGYAPPPPYYPPHREIGYRCDAFRPPRFGAGHEICPIRDPKPIGEPCACPPPPGYGGPWLRGRTIP